MTRHKLLVSFLFCLSASLALRAQSYSLPDEVSRFDASAVYCIDVQDATGRSISNQFADEGAIGAFVGTELRGVSQLTPSLSQQGKSVLTIRVWGNADDPSTVTFRTKSNNVEYQISTQTFDASREVTYGSPSAPVAITFEPLTGLRLDPTNVLVTLGSTAQATPVLLPDNHSTVLSTITYKYGTSAPEVFTVDDRGVVSGLQIGNGYLTARAMTGDTELYSAMATVSVVKQYVPVASIRNNLPSTDIHAYVDGDINLDFTVLPEDATITSVSYTIGNEDLIGYNEYEPGKFNFRAFAPGQTTITVTSDDNPQATLVYNITIDEPPLEWLSFNMPTLRLMVGNDVTPYLPNLLTWGPADKPLPPMTYEVVDGDAIAKNSEGHIVAVKTGTAQLRASVTGLSSVFAEVAVEVTYPATGIIVKKDTLRMIYDDPNGMMMNISDDIKNNVVFTPTDYACFGDDMMGIMGCPMFSVTGGYNLNISSSQSWENPRDYNLDATLWGSGTFNVKVELAVPDYLGTAANGGGWAEPIHVVDSFVVVVQAVVNRIELPEDLHVDNGQKLDLTKVLTLYPEDHLPFDYSTLQWNLSDYDKEYVTIKDNILTALKPTFGRSIYLSVEVVGTMMYASTNVYVDNPCQSITIKPGMETIHVENGMSQELTDAINEAFIFSPADHDNEVEWRTEDPSIVDYYSDTFWPMSSGETNVTATIYAMNDEGMLVPRLTASVTVVVTTTIESVEFQYGKTSIHLAVGDDITDVLPQMLEIEPIDCDDPSMTYSIVSGTALTKRADGHIVATSLGEATIQVQSVARPELTCTLDVEVVSPATDIVFKQDEMEFEFSGTGPSAGMEIAEGIKANISFTPTDFQFFGDPTMTSLNPYPEIRSSNDAVINITSSGSSDPRDYNLEAMPWNGGVVNVTVRLSVPDYLTAALDPMGDAAPRYVEKSFKVTLVMDATHIFLPDHIRVEEGKQIDLRDYVEPYPEGSRLNKDLLVFELTDENAKEYVKLDGYTLTGLKPYKSGVYIQVRHPKIDMPASATVVVTRTATSMKVKTGYETIVVDKDDNTTLNKLLGEAVEILPEGHTDDVYWTSTDEKVVEPISNWLNEYTFKTHEVGIADLTATIYNYDDDGIINQTSPRMQVTIRVKVIQPLVEIAISAPATMLVGVPADITITPNKGASVEPTRIKLTETGGYKWAVFSYDKKTENLDGSVSVTVTPLVPATLTVQLVYDDLKAETKSISVDLPTPLAKGWQWLTLWGSNVDKNPAEVFGNNADEVRSQTDLLSRDATEGWFGTLELAPATAYMVKANTDVAAAGSFAQQKGTIVTARTNVSLYKGWTWLAYPYVNSFTPAELKLTPTPGDRIVSKDDGFVEYDDGKWTGTLTAFSPYAAYLYYNNAGQAATLTWQSESSLYTAAHPAAREVLLADIATDAETTATRQTDARSSHWTYDHSAYRNNMTMVARLDADGTDVLRQADADRYTIGAFVGSECRGEGQAVDGLMFITVHANAGELVSFRLYDSQQDFEFTVNEQVVAAMMLGSISQPYRLTFDQTQGVENIEHSTLSIEHYYDLQGRKRSAQDSRRSTLLIERQANGKYRKVVVR